MGLHLFKKNSHTKSSFDSKGQLLEDASIAAQTDVETEIEAPESDVSKASHKGSFFHHSTEYKDKKAAEKLEKAKAKQEALEAKQEAKLAKELEKEHKEAVREKKGSFFHHSTDYRNNKATEKHEREVAKAQNKVLIDLKKLEKDKLKADQHGSFWRHSGGHIIDKDYKKLDQHTKQYVDKVNEPVKKDNSRHGSFWRHSDEYIATRKENEKNNGSFFSHSTGYKKQHAKTEGEKHNEKGNFWKHSRDYWESGGVRHAGTKKAVEILKKVVGGSEVDTAAKAIVDNSFNVKRQKADDQVIQGLLVDYPSVVAFFKQWATYANKFYEHGSFLGLGIKHVSDSHLERIQYVLHNSLEKFEEYVVPALADYCILSNYCSQLFYVGCAERYIHGDLQYSGNSSVMSNMDKTFGVAHELMYRLEAIIKAVIDKNPKYDYSSVQKAYFCLGRSVEEVFRFYMSVIQGNATFIDAIATGMDYESLQAIYLAGMKDYCHTTAFAGKANKSDMGGSMMLIGGMLALAYMLTKKR